MSKFLYKAFDAKGQEKSGSIAAENKLAALQKLREEYLTVIDLQEEIYLKKLWAKQRRTNGEKISIDFCRQLSVMLAAGIPILEAVKICSGDMKASDKENMVNVLSFLERGYSLSEAMSTGEGCFSPFVIAMVKAGEVSGNLSEVLGKLHVLLKKRYDARQKLKMAMIYPLFLCVLSGLLLFFLLYSVLPVFSDVFTSFDAELPLLTRLLIDISNNLQSYVLVLGGLLVAFGLLLKLAFRLRSVAIKLDELILRMPVWGKLYLRSEQTIFLSTLSMMARSGIRLNAGIDILKSMCTNRQWQFVYESMIAQLEQGYGLGVCMEKSKMFPPVILTMVKAGEQSGEMAKMLAYGSDICQEEEGILLKKINVLAEPVVILLIGGVVGIIVMGTILPIIDLMSVM